MQRALFLIVPVALAGVIVGCAQQDAPKTPKATKVAETKEHDHSGWWCQEHGVPEEECSLCSAEVAEKFKKAGDWCKLHDRAQSQCFKCDPKLYEKFEARYVAKYGKKPERPDQDEFTK